MSDGVSVVARNWIEAVSQLGFDTITVAGEGPVDRTVPGLAIDAETPAQRGEVAEALSDADLVVVANLCTIPLNLDAASVVASVLRGRPTVMHHHDPPWQRDRFAKVTELPIDDPAWRHVTINELTSNEMAARGFAATCIYSGFAEAADNSSQRATVDRGVIRALLGVDDDALLFAHPVRAIERKNIGAAIALTEALGACYWLWGPAEEGYDSRLESLLHAAACPVVRGTTGARSVDLYGAADAVVFPSTWEGFGLPPIEAAIHRLPAAVGDYPVAAELLELGFRWFGTQDPAPLGAFLADPDPDLLQHNRQLALQHFSLDALRKRIAALLTEMELTDLLSSTYRTTTYRTTT